MRSKQTILIVDDIKENIDVLLELLREYDCIPALDGESAIEIAQEEDIDLILLDIMMPDMDGFKVSRRLKANPMSRKVPIIFLTAKNKQEDIQKGFACGGVDYITKPFHYDELQARIDTHLKLKKYEKDLEKQVRIEVEQNRLKQQMIFQQSKQAALGEQLMHISHQWQQPLASLGSIVTLLNAKLNMGVAVSQEEYLDSLQRSEKLIKFMSSTIDTFSSFYTSSAEYSTIYLKECIKQVLLVLDATFEFENITVVLNINESEPVYINRNELSQVVFAILNNARDIFKKRGVEKPVINIEIANKTIRISDNGGGIEEEFFEKLFVLFESNNNSSGIGLYLCKNLVEKNGGVIHAQNNKHGATFLIEFLTWID